MNIFSSPIVTILSAYDEKPTTLVDVVATTIQTININPPNDGRNYPILLFMGFSCEEIQNITWYIQRVSSIGEIVAYGSNPIIFCDNQTYRKGGWTYNLKAGLVQNASSAVVRYKSAIAMVTKR
jgi:hypothetical protein